jgi:TPR repeat protein
MSRRVTGGAVKRSMQQLVEEEEEPASLEATLHQLLPLTLRAVVKAHFDTLVWLQLCNPQGVSLLSFVRLPPRLRRPFTGAPVYDLSLTQAKRMYAVGCGLKGKLVWLLSQGVNYTATSTAATATSVTSAVETLTATNNTTTTITRTTTTVSIVATTAHHTSYLEPQRNWPFCLRLMQNCVLRVASKLMAAVRDEAAKKAEELCASGRCAAAVVPLQQAISLGNLPSRALMAWLLIDGREGVAKDEKRGFDLAEEGERLGCHQCQGVLAYCYRWGYGCERDMAQSLGFARESSGRGSRYGQYTLGGLHYYGDGGLAQDFTQAVVLFRLAVAQDLDAAKSMLGTLYYRGEGVAQSYPGALRLYQRAAAQGYLLALYMVAHCHEHGVGVRRSKAVAVRWYRRAQAAGYTAAAVILQELGA